MSKPKKIKPMAASQRITRNEFCATHFNAAQFNSDMFYVGLANKVFPIVRNTFSAQPGFDNDVSKRMSVVLACYVEDLVSGSGVWAAFTSLYRKKYGVSFPFYNIRESTFLFPYDDERPSFHAVLFLLWYVANEVKADTMLNPANPALRMLAMALMPELAKAYDEAPESPARPMLQPEDESCVPLFYQIRNLCEWLCDRCYLTRINNRKRVAEDFKEFISKTLQALGDENEDALDYALESFVPMNALIGPLAVPAYEWLAEIVDLYHEPEEECYISVLAGMKSRPYEYYRYESVGTQELVLTDSDGNKLTLSASTMPGERFASGIAPGKSALMSLVLLDGVWVMNGIGLQGLPPEIYEECRDAHKKKDKERKDVYRYLMKRFGKQRMGVCGSYEEYIKLAYGDDAAGVHSDPVLVENIRTAGNLLYFLNTDGTVTMLPGWAGCVKIKDNPYYNEEDASRDGISLILNHSLSTPEMRQYIISKKLIPDAALSSVISPEAGRKMFQKNISFLNDYSGRDTMPFLMEV